VDEIPEKMVTELTVLEKVEEEMDSGNRNGQSTVKS
jgi:hypothetical protein